MEALLQEIRGRRYELQCVRSFEEGIDALGRQRWDVCLVDYRVGSRDGLELIREAYRRKSGCPFVLLTGFGGPDIDLSAMQAGAFGYLEKDGLCADALDRTIYHAVEAERRRSQRRRLAFLGGLDRRSDCRSPDEAMGTLRTDQWATFEALAARYAALLEEALQRRAYRIENRVTDSLRMIGDELGLLGAGPRDVVELHCLATADKTAGVSPERAQATVEEGNLMVLELMGYLASFYRRLALGCSCCPLAGSRRPKVGVSETLHE